jgi:hypothetical protein
VRVANALNKTFDERRDFVAEMLIFIRDFNKLDTELLVEKVYADDKFLEAAEAVLQSAVGPWKSMEALRDFAVQALYGEKPPLEGLTDRIRRSEGSRVSPFSVPFAFLRALAPNPGQLDVRRLSSLSQAEAIDVNGNVGEENRWEVRVPGGQAWLVTTLWARMLPPRHTPKAKVTVTNFADNRILHEGRFWALAVEPMPCFWWLHHHSTLEIRLTRQQQEEPHSVLLAIEGWRYTLG